LEGNPAQLGLKLLDSRSRTALFLKQQPEKETYPKKVIWDECLERARECGKIASSRIGQ